MPLQSTRRRVLRGGSVLAATALAGCSAIPGIGGSSNPDAGTDSYGLRVTNETDHTYPVTITAGPRSGDELVFDETVESTPDENHEWDEVLTGEGLFVVEATVDDDHFHEEGGQPRRTVSVGTPNAVDVYDVLVRLLPEMDGVTVEVDFDWQRG